jgi:N-acetylmuramoyl-L-alanine amidase
VKAVPKRVGKFVFAITVLVVVVTVLWHIQSGGVFGGRAAYHREKEDRLPYIAEVDLADPGQSYSYNLELMARVISAEAKGEPYLGQVAVGAVILNRLDHPHFPKTIPGVIFEPDAFTAVTTGHVWYPPVSSSYRAAQDALAGWDPSGGAVYYYNPAKATNWWVATRSYIIQIGKHIFLR